MSGIGLIALGRGISLSVVLSALALCLPVAAAADVPVRQVLIEARILIASDDFARELGVRFGDAGNGLTTGTFTPANGLAGIDFTGLGSVVSSLELGTVTGQPTTIFLGGEVPDAGGRAATGRVGTQLSVIPRLTDQDRLSLEIESMLNEVAGTAQAPVLTTTTTNTTVAVPDRGSLVVGGLVSEDLVIQADQIPWLRDLPFLGQLFRNEGFRRGEEQIYVILQPTILGGPTQSVQIEARFAEVNIADMRELGVDLLGDAGEQAQPVDLNAALSALNRSGLSEVVSVPRVTTADNQVATLQAGTRIPFVTSAGTPPPVAFQDAALTLQVTPRITPDGAVIMDLNLTPNEPQVGSSGAPAFATRTIQTDVLIRDGQTVVMGGIFRDVDRETVGKIPVLGSIPYLGRLFRNRDADEARTEVVVFITPTLYDDDGNPVRASSAPPPRTRTGSDVRTARAGGSGASGGYYRQQFAPMSGGLGVTGVLQDEKPVLTLPTSIDTGGGGLSIVVPIPIPGTSFVLDGSFGMGDRDFSNRIPGEMFQIQGISYWQKADDGSTGVSSTGASIGGNGNLELDAFDVRTGVQIDVTDPVRGVMERVRRMIGIVSAEEPARDIEVGSGGVRPGTYLEITGRAGYIRQRAWQQVMLTNDDPFFTRFDVHTRNDLELTEWSGTLGLGLVQAVPIPGVPGLVFTVGGNVGIGYRDSSGDGHQRNRCDIRSVQQPNTNLCDPAIRDFDIGESLDTSGFDWTLGATGGIQYELSCLLDGLVTGIDYDFDYVGISRFNTPTNLDEDGGLSLQRTHQPRHRLGAFVRYVF